MAAECEIRPAEPCDLRSATALLESASLPVEDLDGEKLENFLVASSGNTVAGVIGLERFGAIGLLRSLVVAPAYRDAGLGRRLVATLEARAAAAGVRQLWLLTIDADGWFENADYVRSDRSEAPATIASTAEFTSLCPGNAVLMTKSL